MYFLHIILMKYLIITAHPSSKGFTHRIAKTITETVQKKGATAKVIDLYAPEHALPFFSFEDIKNLPEIPLVAAFQKDVMDADELIFIHPLWWGGLPAIMKNWIDHVFASGFAYKYTKQGPVGLLKGKTGRVFVTGGSKKWMYHMLFFPFFIIWRLFVMYFCGIRTKNTTYFHNGPKVTPEEHEKNLAHVASYFK